MSRLFKKSKKSLVILLTIAFVMSIAAVPAFAGLSSVIAPRVEANATQDLGTFDIEIEDIQAPAGGADHAAYVELPVDYEINEIRATVSVTDGVYDDYSGIAIDNVDFASAQQYFDIGGDDGFTITISNEFAENNEGKDVEIRIAFRSSDTFDYDFNESVYVPSGETGNIYATVVEVSGGQFPEGDVLIARIDVGELQLVVRDATSFVDEGEVEIRITESFSGTWDSEDRLRLRLPRYFSWEDAEFKAVVFGDPLESYFDDNDDDNDYVTGDAGDSIEFTEDGRNLWIDYVGEGTIARTAFDFTATVVVDDDERAAKGDVVAEVLGDYDATPDELIVGVFGDFDVTITADDPPTVYAGKTEQSIADISIAEDVGRTVVPGRVLTLNLPDWAVWVEESLEGFSDSHRGLEIDFKDLRRDGRQARFDVSGEFDVRGEPATLDLEDFEIALSTVAEGDVVVTVGGTAAVFGEVTVAEAVKAVEMDLVDVPYVESGRSGQQMATIYITETAAGNLTEGENITLSMGRYFEWDSGYTVEVVEGDIELKAAVRATDTAAGLSNRFLHIPVDFESDEASTIRVTSYATVHRGAPIGANNVTLTGSAVHDGGEEVGRDADDEAITLSDRFAPMPPAASGVIAYVDEEPVLDVTEVVMWIGLTTYTVDGEAKEMDVAPFIENDRTFVPISFIANEFGLEADWGPRESLTEWVTFESDDILVEIEIGSPYITVTEDGVSRTVTSDVAAQIVNDRTYLPLRAVGEIFGASFDWGPKETLTEWVSFTLPN